MAEIHFPQASLQSNDLPTQGNHPQPNDQSQANRQANYPPISRADLRSDGLYISQADPPTPDPQFKNITWSETTKLPNSTPNPTLTPQPSLSALPQRPNPTTRSSSSASIFTETSSIAPTTRRGLFRLNPILTSLTALQLVLTIALIPVTITATYVCLTHGAMAEGILILVDTFAGVTIALGALSNVAYFIWPAKFGSSKPRAAKVIQIVGLTLWFAHAVLATFAGFAAEVEIRKTEPDYLGVVAAWIFLAIFFWPLELLKVVCMDRFMLRRSRGQKKRHYFKGLIEHV